MNTQERMIDKRTFRIAVIAVAAAVLLAAAAYLFGAGLRADTSASVAAVSRAAALSAQAQRRADFYADLNNSASAASRAAALSAQAQRRADFYADMNNSARAAAASPTGPSGVK